MPDYIQLLESKLSPNQKQALNAVTDVARARGITVFLTGGAVRDIVSGASVRDLDITVQGNPLKFKKELEKAGFAITGQHDPSQTLYLRFGKQARLEISRARTENFPKPAHPEYESAGILDDLRRRDFTANAMALSLNEGSWGLLLDPLNGMADISSRQLRLVGSYGFLEDPIRLVRAIRLLSRTGWEMEERTRARYENAKDEGVISAVTAAQRGYELEEIAYEEEPLHAMKALESEGWMEHLSTAWTSHSVDVAGLDRLHERFVQLLMAGLHPDPSAAQFRVLAAKLSSNQLSALKRLFVRQDLIREAEALDAEAKKFLQQITSKDAAKPSQLWKLFHNAKPEAVLWLFFTGKTAAIQSRFDSFFTKWPEARQKIPNAILQDMRILPEVEGYAELLDKLTFAFMDAELPTEEAIRKFAEPYSPPAPPPPVIVRRSRSVKRVVDAKGSKGKGKKASKKAAAEETGQTSLAAAAEPGAAVAGVPSQSAAPAAPGAASRKAAGSKSATSKLAAKGVATPAKAIAPAAEKKAAGAAKTVKPGKIKPAQATHAHPAGKAAKSAKSAAAKPVKSAGKAGGRPQKTASTAKPSGKKAHAAARPTAKKPVKSAVKSHAVARASAQPAHKTISKSATAKKKAISKAPPKKAGSRPLKRATKSSSKVAAKSPRKVGAKSKAKPAGVKKKSGR